jgi:HEAT repeat protein
MRYTETTDVSDRARAFLLLSEMERAFERKDPSFFNRVLEEEAALVLRVHAVTALSEIGDETSVPVLGEVLKNDPSSLVRHEAAFSLGQMGLKSSVPYLIDASLKDTSEIVRHESAAALGAIGDEKAREALEKASEDSNEEVRGSALASLFNLDYLRFIANTRNKERFDPEELSAAIEEKRKMSSQRKMPHP